MCYFSAKDNELVYKTFFEMILIDNFKVSLIYFIHFLSNIKKIDNTIVN